MDNYIEPFFKLNIPDTVEGAPAISYSQYSTYAKCPHRWKVTYADKKRKPTHSIATVFGTAMHEVLQEWLTELFNGSVATSDAMDLHGMLKEKMSSEYLKCLEDFNGEHFSNRTEMMEFYNDGIAIIEWVKRRRHEFFSRKEYELIGIEVPIYMPVEEGKNVYMRGYIDLVLKDKATGEYIIYDIKTSRQGWNKWMKADKLKISQVILYKIYFAKQFDIPVEKVKLKYFIVKRKLLEGYMYPQKRATEFTPASGKPSQNKVMKDVQAFVERCFNEDGTHNTEGVFNPVAGKSNKNCKWCPFKEDYELCPKSDRLKE